MRRPSKEAQAQKTVLDPALHSSGVPGCHHLDGPGGRVGIVVSAPSRGDKRSPNPDRDTDGHNHVNSHPDSHPDTNLHLYTYLHLHTYIHPDAYPDTDPDAYPDTDPDTDTNTNIYLYLYLYTYLYPDTHPYVHSHPYPAPYQHPRANPDHLHCDTWRYPFLDSRQVWRHGRGHLGSQRPECINHPEHRTTIDHPLSWAYRRNPS